MSEKINLIAMLEIKDGTWDQVVGAVQECVEKSRAEKGNHNYIAYCQEDHPNRIIFVECWENQEAIEQHTETSHFQKMMETVKPHLAKPLALLNLLPFEERR